LNFKKKTDFAENKKVGWQHNKGGAKQKPRTKQKAGAK